MGLLTQSEVIFPFLEYITGINIFSKWQNPHIGWDIKSIWCSYLFLPSILSDRRSVSVYSEGSFDFTGKCLCLHAHLEI